MRHVPDGPDPAEELWCYDGLRVGHVKALHRMLDEHHHPMHQVASLYAADPDALVTHAFQVAFGGLPMFTWQTTFRSWLFGILVSAGRASGSRAAAGPTPRILADPPQTSSARAHSYADLPWTAWWHDGSWDALDQWMRGRPLAEQEVVALVDRLGWSPAEARDALGWTDEHMAGLRTHTLTALSARMEDEVAGRIVGDAADAGRLVGLLRAPEGPGDRDAILLAYREWRRTRGVSRGRRAAWLVRAGVRGPRATLSVG